MIITNEAKMLLNEALIANSSNCVEAMQRKTCCGTTLVFNLIKLNPDDKPILINGISVMMDNEAQKRAEAVTIDVENGKLIVRDEASSSCSC